MRRRTMMLAGATALVAMPASLQAAQAPSVALQAWVDAFNSRDPRRIVALYAQDAVFWGTTAKTIATTPESIWAYFRDGAQRPWTRVTVNVQHERTYGDTAIVSGAYTFADVRDGVASNIRPARFTFVFRRDGERWLIVDHHSSRVPES